MDEKPITPEIYWEVDAYLRGQLLNKWKTYAAHYYHNGAWWVRCSGQVYNEVCRRGTSEVYCLIQLLTLLDTRTAVGFRVFGGSTERSMPGGQGYNPIKVLR